MILVLCWRNQKHSYSDQYMTLYNVRLLLYRCPYQTDSICVNSTFFSLILIGLWGPGEDRDHHVSTQGGEHTGRGAHNERSTQGGEHTGRGAHRVGSTQGGEHTGRGEECVTSLPCETGRIICSCTICTKREWQFHISKIITSFYAT